MGSRRTGRGPRRGTLQALLIPSSLVLSLQDSDPPDDVTLAQISGEGATAARGSAGPVRDLPGYRIERLLGRGSYGEVWLAHHENTGRDVAVKFFASFEDLDWPMLKREVGKLAQASSERRIVHLLEVGWESDPPYYVMEYLEGGSLAAQVARGPLAPEKAVEVVRDISTALQHLHGKTILHCDLKPSNVLLDASGQIRLADFGQARGMGEEGSAAGTLFYMAPELCEAAARPDVRSDIYSLGALFYTLLTGKPPYAEEPATRELKRGSGPRERIEQYRRIIATSPPPTAHRRVSGVDAELAGILDRCLARDPAHRYSNVQQVQDALAERARRRTLRPLLVFGLVGPIVILGAMSAMGLWAWRGTAGEARASLTRQRQESLGSTARLVASGVDQNLREAQGRVELESSRDDLRRELAAALAAGHPERKPGLRARLQKRLEDIHGADTRKHLFSWTLADGKGVAWARSPYDRNVVGNRYHYREWFSGQSQAASGEPAGIRRATGLTEAFVSTAQNKPVVMSVASPVWAPGRLRVGEPVGVIAATVEVSTFHEWVGVGEGPRLDDGCPSQFAVLLNRGQLIRHPCPAPGAPTLPLDAARFFRPANIEDLLRSETRVTDSYRDPLRDERPYLAVAEPLPNQKGWAVVAQQDRERALAPIASLSKRFESLAGAGLLVGALVTAGLFTLLMRLARGATRAA
jgi:eukaryotic-like serine/threonine-protein kinase